MYTYAGNKQENRSLAVANSLPRQARGGQKTHAKGPLADAVIQRKYDEHNWGEEQIVNNVKGTSRGASIYGAAEAAAGKLGLKLKIVVSDDVHTGATAIDNVEKLLLCFIPGKECEGDATQILAQELGNAAHKKELDEVGSGESARKTKKGDYVKAIESLEYVGAVASHEVFEEAKAKDAEWTKGGAARWKKEEIKDLPTYLECLKETGASAVYEGRWESHNTYLLHAEGDYRLFGVDIKESNEAKIFLVHKGVKVQEGTAKGDFAKMAGNPKLLFLAYVWKHENPENQ